MFDTVSPRFAPLAGPEQRKPAAADAVARPMPARIDSKAAPANSAHPVSSSDLARKLSASPPVDSSRVSELRQTMRAGNFPVQANRIADAMIASLKA